MSKNNAAAVDMFSSQAVDARRWGIVGTGSALPKRQLTNEQLTEFLDTTDEWITGRVGIKSRYVGEPEQTTVDLACEASQRALEAAGMEASEIDLIIFATVSPDQHLPSAAALLQRKLGASGAMAFDLAAACSGFLFALSTADSLQRSGGFKNALVIGAESLSKLLNWEDRNTCVLFGDGAGAVVKTYNPDAPSESSHEILALDLHTQGEQADLIQRKGGAYPKATFPGVETYAGSDEDPYIAMRGREVYKAAVNYMAESVTSVLQQAGKSIEEIDWFVPHQSNKRMLEAVCDRISLKDESKIVVNIDTVGNTSAASIPIALDEAVRDGRIQPGNLVLMTAVGAGITYGAVLLRW